MHNYMRQVGIPQYALKPVLSCAVQESCALSGLAASSNPVVRALKRLVSWLCFLGHVFGNCSVL